MCQKINIVNCFYYNDLCEYTSIDAENELILRIFILEGKKSEIGVEKMKKSP